MDIGPKIRTLRKNLNMSVRQLSELSECTPSFISQIERNIANPSINTLKKIADILNVPLIHFFEENTNQNESEDEYIIRKKRRKKLNSPAEKAEVFLLTPTNNMRNIEMHMIVIEPGGKSDKLYVNSAEEVGYVLKGKLTLYLGEERFEVNEGDSIYFPGNLPHGWANESNTEVITLWAATPPIIRNKSF
ncbi:XRE family transcriptional regulator [Bacillus canaveralius]|uniref:XRE family transcriptional regulator n=1 Tax=Bacillus canaveralius TaxID=1403243 RepID=A0A2N5GL60_9BACI|nr:MULTISPECIES: cupin domain-containing protein [Bacillus]PLR81254.1 XRE family transcriptional regulator [Bacillus sp. V33-4]PLR82297.1 XRE family transcriptional regulator [Bacillus canaveralius]PLR99466.1 XRE family transcriptional regulator [Bacillus canaveralius]RSK49097.1 cupin domain-containing protein [Bacillus canaveralius]